MVAKILAIGLVGSILLLGALYSIAPADPNHAENVKSQQFIRLASPADISKTGLWDEIIPTYESESGKKVPCGTGASLEVQRATPVFRDRAPGPQARDV